MINLHIDNNSGTMSNPNVFFNEKPIGVYPSDIPNYIFITDAHIKILIREVGLTNRTVYISKNELIKVLKLRSFI